MKINKQLVVSIATVIVLADQLSKIIAREMLSIGYSYPLIPKLIHLKYVKNTGAAFSLFSNSTTLLSILSLVVSISLLIWIYKSYEINKWQGLSIAFLLGGTIGNGIDRWLFGYVTDFIEIAAINFPIFNFADIAINLAIICFLLENISKEFRSRKGF